jgi:hypothetical protein
MPQAQKLQIEKRQWNDRFASALFVSEVLIKAAATDHELRKQGTSGEPRSDGEFARGAAPNSGACVDRDR